MEKLLLNLGLLLTVSLASVVFNSCEGDDITVTSIRLEPQTLILAIGEEHSLTATVLPKDATDKTIAWTSSAEAVAIVADGKVSAKSEGMTTIAAKAGKQTTECVVTVIDPSTVEKGVVINGVKWATRNVDAPGTFAAKPEDSGMFYQWNCIVAWSATNPRKNSNGGTTWDGSISSSHTWEKSNDPSPAGWRVPNLDEIQKMFDSDKVNDEWVSQEGINGRKFTDKATGNSIFLPAAGYRRYYDGTLCNVGSNGSYWGSSMYGSYDANLLYFNSDYARWYSYYYHGGGSSVRPVANQ